MRERFNGIAFWAKQRFFRPRANRLYRELLANQQSSSDEISEINWIKRKRLLEFAYAHSPFYRERFDEMGLLPADIRCREDWHLVPILTKQNLRDSFAEIVVSGIEPRYCEESTTGGSTGQPTKVYHDRRFPKEILGWRAMHWWGHSPGDNVAFSYRMPARSLARQTLNTLMWWPTRRIWLDASNMSPEATSSFLVNFNRMQPSLLVGYVGAVSHLAEVAAVHELKMHSPRSVWVTSAPLSQVQRRLIERVFQSPVCDQYGCSEVFWLACQCPGRQGLHVFSDSRHLEAVTEDDRLCADGHAGRLLVTDLENYVFPILRYENGDRGHVLQGQCSCGLPFPMLAPIQGRISENLRLPNGTVIGGEFLTTLFDDYPEAVLAFQVYQRKDYSIVLRVIPGHSGSNDSVLERVRMGLADRIRDNVAVDLEITDSIPSDRGKTRYIVSDVD